MRKPFRSIGKSVGSVVMRPKASGLESEAERATTCYIVGEGVNSGEFDSDGYNPGGAPADMETSGKGRRHSLFCELMAQEAPRNRTRRRRR